jgi:hypothetical protein
VRQCFQSPLTVAYRRTANRTYFSRQQQANFIPDSAHLIVCAPSLVDNWVSEIKKSTGDAFQVLKYRTKGDHQKIFGTGGTFLGLKRKHLAIVVASFAVSKLLLVQVTSGFNKF